MKRYMIYVIGLMAAAAMSSSARPTEQNHENTVRAIKIKELNLRKANIQKQIKIEDGKRHQVLTGVTVERQEELNDKQDSICLALRSQLVSVELELKELVADK